MAALELDAFERQLEAFAHARAWREWQYQAALRPGRSLTTLYEDFPDLVSIDLYNDLQDAADAEPSRRRALTALLAAANLEGRTREFASRAAAFPVRTSIEFEGTDIVWREAPAHWTALVEVTRRHALAETWRSMFRSELNPTLERWHEALRRELAALGGTDWIGFWSEQRAFDAAELARLANAFLEQSGDVFGHALGVYLGLLELPIDDVWSADIDAAFRAPRFDMQFPAPSRMPTLVRAFRDLGVEIESQTALHLEASSMPGAHVLVVDVPNEVHVLLGLVGGYQDYLAGLRGVGSAQLALHTDATLPFWQRWLGDATPGIAYGLLFEGLGRNKGWLTARLDVVNSDDYRVIAHIAWLYRVRRAAASVLYEQQLWRTEPGGSVAADYETAFSGALRTRHFGDEYVGIMLDQPWSTLSSAADLRAELFAAQLRAYLQREFDEEWWRSARAGRFLVQELWRVGRRHTAEELLGFMGYEGFDPTVLWSEFSEVLSPL